jgi:protease-4
MSLRNHFNEWIAQLFKGKKNALHLIETLPQDREVQVAMANVILADIIKERRHNRIWLLLKRFVFALMFLIGLFYYFALQLQIHGWRLVPSKPLVGVIRIQGSIMSNSIASADKVIPVLKRAFKTDNVEAIVLSIDSPGGAPVEAERINYMIDELKVKYKKPVYAVIENVGASAAYMIALHADQIYAGRYSMVGSIGAIMSAWDLHKALAKFDIYQRVYASGELKAMLNPFIPPTQAADEKAQSIVTVMGQRFEDELHERRGKFLQANMKYDTGEIWDGVAAKRLGLIDDLGTIESITLKYPDAKLFDFGPRNSGMGIFAASIGDWLQSIMTSAFRSVVTEEPTIQ